MRVVRDARETRSAAGQARIEGRRIALVPTMGAFHEGHLSLMRAARRTGEVVVVSIFVNPLQFGPREDFDAYPRDERRDLDLAADEGVDLVFAPSIEEMHPTGRSTTVSVGALGHLLEGDSRPGHFEGVCTVVAQLLNVVRPDIAFFGQKDAQQVAVIKRMVADLCFDVDIAVCPTVRDHDGLALSSRNRLLHRDDRRRATALHRALQAGAGLASESAPLDVVEKQMWDVLRSEHGVAPDYARAVDPDHFESPRPGGPVLLVVAAHVGRIRLIDNLLAPARSSKVS
jgi:pantoate--beta-alanine ligase